MSPTAGESATEPGVDRRSLLRGALGIGATAVAAGTAGYAVHGARAGGDPADGSAATGARAGDAVAAAAVPASWTAPVPFHGPRQAGVTTRAPQRALFVAFDVTATGPAALVELLRTLTDRARFLTAGGTPADADPAGPPSDSGLLGALVPADGLTVTVGLGSSLFDDRFGLAARRPAGLRTMPTFPDDALDPAQCHGDLSVQLCAAHTDTLLHALRDLTRHTRGAMQPRWRVDGFLNPSRPVGTQRNLMGFKDGIANPDVRDPAEMERLVWIPAAAGSALAGGTFQVIRVVRMLVESWDRTTLREQERTIGRARDTGAPLDGSSEQDVPRYGDDPQGAIVPLGAHIRRANPRTTATEASRLLRRGYNFDRGIDVNGTLDVGLVFCAYQQDVARQFEAVQARLAGEALARFVQPTGGGYFLVPPGVRDGRDWFGSGLFTPRAAGPAAS